MSGYPPPEIIWFFNGKLVQQAPGIHIKSITDGEEVQSQLYLQNMKSEVQGNYTCVGTSRGGKTEIPFEVILLEAPKIIESSENTMVFMNSTVTLTCEVIGSPKPKITWLHNGRSLHLNSNAQVSPNYRTIGHGNLMIVHAQHQHGGNYTCIAENEAGKDSAETVVTVYESSSNSDNIITIQQVTQSGNITFTCQLNSNPPPKIKWTRNEVDISMHMDRSRFIISPDGITLTVMNVTAEDRGQYKCEATNLPGDINKIYILDVSTSPTIQVDGSSESCVEILQGNELQLRCFAIANPWPTYQWLKDKVLIAHSSHGPLINETQQREEDFKLVTLDPRVELQDIGRKIVIKNAQPGDAGRYTCIAQNRVGQDTLHINVSVISPPTFVDSVEREEPELEKGKLGELICNVTSIPKAVIEWNFVSIQLMLNQLVD
ncbi:Hemicentin-1 [Cichlidogyrus casuarinus]|uniref:Hemicentin-1 n=1 Tax=Cichlidogyrus casuarinus TaxID=1844966 RepID=A0ABD2QH47_9PLAT